MHYQLISPPSYIRRTRCTRLERNMIVVFLIDSNGKPKYTLRAFQLRDGRGRAPLSSQQAAAVREKVYGHLETGAASPVTVIGCRTERFKSYSKKHYGAKSTERNLARLLASAEKRQHCSSEVIDIFSVNNREFIF